VIVVDIVAELQICQGKVVVAVTFNIIFVAVDDEIID